MVKDMGEPPRDWEGDAGLASGASAQGHASGAATCDALLGGRLRLRQPQVGYRAGLDAALLAAAVALEPGERGLEAGCGPGGALLQVAVRNADATLVGVEKDEVALALARENIALNGLQAQVDVLAGDVGGRFAMLRLPPFDVAFANPPFFDDPGALRAPHPARRAAWMAEDGLGAWTSFLLKSVREGGRIVVVHRADRLGDLLVGLGEGAGSLQVRAVHAFGDRPAKRVLVRAVKTGRAPLVLLPPLVLRDANGPRSQAEAILRGEAALDWT